MKMNEYLEISMSSGGQICSTGSPRDHYYALLYTRAAYTSTLGMVTVYTALHAHTHRDLSSLSLRGKAIQIHRQFQTQFIDS